VLTLINKLIANKLIKFLFVGGINTAFGYLMFSLTLYLVEQPYLSVLIATIISIIFNFKTYSKLVFKSDDNSLIYRFFGVYLLGMTMQMGLIKLFALNGIDNVYLVAAIIAGPMVLLSYILMNKFVFIKPTP
jgi:putative flippase GtrA